MGNTAEPSTPASRKEKYRQELNSNPLASAKIEEKERNEVIIEKMKQDLRVIVRKLDRGKKDLNKLETKYERELRILSGKRSNSNDIKALREKAHQLVVIRKSIAKNNRSHGIVTVAIQNINDGQLVHDTARVVEISTATLKKINQIIDPTKMATISNEAQKQLFLSKTVADFVEQGFESIADSDESEDDAEKEIMDKICAEFDLNFQTQTGQVPSTDPSNQSSNDGDKVSTTTTTTDFNQAQDYEISQRIHNLKSKQSTSPHDD